MLVLVFHFFFKRATFDKIWTCCVFIFSKKCYLRKYTVVGCKVYGDVWVHVYVFWVHVYGSVGCMYAEVGCKFHNG